MQVEILENCIAVAIKQPGLFKSDSFRTITISEDQGIEAEVGKLKADPDGAAAIRAYRFNRAQWNEEKARRWIEQNRGNGSGNDGYERRYLEHPVRMDFENKKAPIIEGYAAVWDKPTTIVPGYREQIKRGAFLDTMKVDDIRALWNHNADYLLGRNKSDTLSLREDENGLKYRIIAPETSWAKDLIVLIKRGDLSQSSFGFHITGKEDDYDEETRTLTRTVTKAKLFDVSPVTFPAYKETEVHVRMSRNAGTLDYVFLDSDEVISCPIPEQEFREEDLPTIDELDAEWRKIQAELRRPRQRLINRGE